MQYPARSDNQIVAQIVGCHPSKVCVLAKATLLEYLNGDLFGVVKVCATIDVLIRTSEHRWQVRATQVLAGQNLPVSELSGQIRKPRARGLHTTSNSPADMSLTLETIRKQFIEQLAMTSDGKPISALLPDPEIARILGFRVHDLAPLRRIGLLKADNQERKSAKKLHSREYILGLALDVAWLRDATRAINAYWRHKNGRKGKGPLGG